MDNSYNANCYDFFNYVSTEVSFLAGNSWNFILEEFLNIL